MNGKARHRTGRHHTARHANSRHGKARQGTIPHVFLLGWEPFESQAELCYPTRWQTNTNNPSPNQQHRAHGRSLINPLRDAVAKGDDKALQATLQHIDALDAAAAAAAGAAAPKLTPAAPAAPVKSNAGFDDSDVDLTSQGDRKAALEDQPAGEPASKRSCS